jgi:uncharacterized protein (DUF1499 family)
VKRKRVVIIVLMILILAPLGGLALLGVLSRKAPTLGASNGQLKPCPEGSQNCVCSQSESNRIAPFSFQGSGEQALNRLEGIIARQPGATVVERSPTYLRAEFQSRIFRFIDDVEFLAVADENVLHVRSASRVGRSDLGANRKRVESLRTQFDAATAR